MKNMIVVELKRGFSWLGKNLTDMVREVVKLIISIFEMDQNRS